MRQRPITRVLVTLTGCTSPFTHQRATIASWERTSEKPSGGQVHASHPLPSRDRHEHNAQTIEMSHWPLGHTYQLRVVTHHMLIASYARKGEQPSASYIPAMTPVAIQAHSHERTTRFSKLYGRPPPHSRAALVAAQQCAITASYARRGEQPSASYTPAVAPLHLYKATQSRTQHASHKDIT